MGNAYCVSWLSHTGTNTTFFPKSPTTFLTCFSRCDTRKYAEKKVHLNLVSNSQLHPPPPTNSTTRSNTTRSSIERGTAVILMDTVIAFHSLYHFTTQACHLTTFKENFFKHCEKRRGNMLSKKKQENIEAWHQWRRKSVVSEVWHITEGYFLTPSLKVRYFYVYVETKHWTSPYSINKTIWLPPLAFFKRK